MKKPETPLESKVQADCLKWLNAQPHIWAWRRSVGTHQVGRGRFVRYGQEGMSDVEGVVTVTITDAMRLEFDVGLRLEIEVKREGNQPTPKQAAWLAAHAGHGSIACWADSVAMLEHKLRQAFKRRGFDWPE